MFKRFKFIALSLITFYGPASAELTYPIDFRAIDDNTYVLFGKNEPLQTSNGGLIANITYITTDNGVVVFDTGPSRRFGEALKRAIETRTGQPIVRVYNTHHHPDHFFGNQAFDPAIIAAPEQMIRNITTEGDGLSDNMYRLVGDWMRGTHVTAPGLTLNDGQIEQFGDHTLEMIVTHGHTSSDLAIFDRTTKTLIAGDLVFFNRALATPHANIADWLSALDRLDALGVKRIIPGHGPIDNAGQSIDQMRKYLKWLDETLVQSAALGLSMTEVMATPLPKWTRSIMLTRYEFIRSVNHLYRQYEDSAYQ